MSILEFIVLLVIAAVAGSIGMFFGGGRSAGFLVSVVVGFVGAFVGTWLSRSLGLPEFFTFELAGNSFPFVWAVIGSAVLVAVIGFFTK